MKKGWRVASRPSAVGSDWLSCVLLLWGWLSDGLTTVLLLFGDLAARRLPRLPGLRSRLGLHHLRVLGLGERIPLMPVSVISTFEPFLDLHRTCARSCPSVDRVAVPRFFASALARLSKSSHVTPCAIWVKNRQFRYRKTVL
jgi:hypothetical protein